MGGNAFTKMTVVRMNREDLNNLYKQIVETLDFPNLTVEYLKNAQLGSTGKNKTTGDVDLCLNDYSNPYDEISFDWNKFVLKLRKVLPQNQFVKNHLQYNTLWPYQDGFVQVDFLYGNLEYMRFAHWSPGENNSAFKGVYWTTAMGVWAKLHNLWSYEDEKVYAKISYNLDLNHGLAVRYRVLNKEHNSKKNYSRHWFETKFPCCPSPRWDFLNDVNAIVRVLFGNDVVFEQINSFEKLVNFVKKNHCDKFEKFKENYMYAMRNKRHMPMTMEELNNHTIWN